MVRSLQIALLAVVFAVALLPGAPAQALTSDPAHPAVATASGDSPGRSNPYAGTDGASPLDEVPVVPMIGGTVGLLGILGLFAVRRGWI